MATRLSAPVTREVEGADGTAYTVRLTAQGILIRLKGKRDWFGPYPYGGLYVRAAQVKAALDAEMKPARKRRVSRNLLKGR